MMPRVTRAAIFLSLLLISCQSAPTASAPPAPPHSNVLQLTADGLANARIETTLLKERSFSPHLETTATITADPQHMARVGSHMAGRVASIKVRLGDTVRVGQPLVEIDTVELHHVSTDYLTALARAREANDTLGRQKQLVEERVGPMQDLRRAEATAQTADASLREAEEHLHFLGLDNAAIEGLRTGKADGPLRSVLRAPIAGRVEALQVILGQVLTGTEDLLTIMLLEKVWATLRVYERDLPDVARDAPVEVRVPSYRDRVFTGQIESISDLVDTSTRTVEVRARVDNPEGVLKPGMSAVAAVALQAASQSLWLPADAVQAYGTDRVVFVKTGERRFAPHKVAVGLERGGYVPVESGLQVGSEVVVRGAFALRGELERNELQGD